MKLQLGLCIWALALLAWVPDASANSVTCSSADQGLSYSHRTSNGGAPLDMTILSYEGLTQISSNMNDPYVEWGLEGRTDVSTETSGGTTVSTFVGLASGTIRSGDQSIPFSKRVICEELIAPMCPLCP